ncbi:MAG: hypothetical protein ACLRLX_02090 [Anaerovoracaceae bacterium]
MIKIFKLTACILIVLSCSAIGFIKASSYKFRRMELENTLELIRLLNLEISYRKDSLNKTFERVSALKPCWFAEVLKECGTFLSEQKPLNVSWQEALENNMSSCPLLPKDIEILKDVSMGLGRSDTQGQKKIIEPALARIESSINEARNAELKMGKMYRSLGIAAGIVIAVILI